MYKIYIKQAWQILKEDKVVSIISILGTALAITMVMVMILTQEIKTTNIAPEVNRERTMYIKWTREESRNGNSINVNMVSGKLYKQYLSQLKTPEAISMQNRSQNRIYLANSDKFFKADIMDTDPEFWNIYRLSFLEGKPFSREDFQSGIPSAVICEDLAQKLFGGDSALGKEFEYKNKVYKVCGVVKNVSSLCYNAYSQVWIPYTSKYEQDNGYFSITILAKDKKDFSKIKKEVRENEVRYSTQADKYTVKFIGPYSCQESLVKEDNMTNNEPDMKKNFRKFYITLAILLLVPAINLSGFSLFKIINRTSEIGIRKAFGANKSKILIQVLYENLLTSILGGIIGLILSYSVVTLLKDRLFASEEKFIGENTIPVSAFISPSVFLYVFLICVALNLLSSGIPAWRASRMRIVEAINS